MKDVNKFFSLKWNGLEVPCNYLLKGPDKYLEKAVYHKRYCWKRKDYLMKSILFFISLSLISPVGLYPGISPWAFMQGGLIWRVIGYIIWESNVTNLSYTNSHALKLTYWYGAMWLSIAFENNFCINMYMPSTYRDSSTIKVFIVLTDLNLKT